MSLTSLALGLAYAGHAGQFRHDGVTPYITHPLRVFRMLSMMSPQIRATALIHDLMEDNPAITPEVLLQSGLDPVVVAAAGYLTRQKDQPYAHYIEVIIGDKDGLSYTKGQNIAALVKVVDIIDNMMDSPTPSMVKRYYKALHVIMRAFPNLTHMMTDISRPDMAPNGNLLEVWQEMLANPKLNS